MKGKNSFIFGENYFLQIFHTNLKFGFIKKCIFTWFIHKFNKPMKPQLTAMNWIYDSSRTCHLEISNFVFANVMSKIGTNLLDRNLPGQTMLDI